MNATRTLAATATLALAAPAAFAGGYQVPVVEPVVIAPVVETAPDLWTGAYGGLTLGYVVSGDERVGFSDAADDEYLATLGSLDLSGPQMGLRLGYRMQRDRWVLGAELGYEASRAKGDLTVVDPFAEGTADSLTVTSKVDNVLALRFKTGHLVGEDNRTMVYGIAGVARGNFTYEVSGTSDGQTNSLSRDYSQSGYVLGLGVERKFTDAISVTGEWEYARFGKTDLEFDGGVTRATPKYNILRLGVNFQF